MNQKNKINDQLFLDLDAVLEQLAIKISQTQMATTNAAHQETLRKVYYHVLICRLWLNKENRQIKADFDVQTLLAKFLANALTPEIIVFWASSATRVQLETLPVVPFPIRPVSSEFHSRVFHYFPYEDSFEQLKRMVANFHEILLNSEPADKKNHKHITNLDIVELMMEIAISFLQNDRELHKSSLEKFYNIAVFLFGQDIGYSKTF